MKRNALKIHLFALAVLFSGSSVWAQDVYVTAAQIHISITHHLLLDVFLNGNPIISSTDHLNDAQADITQDFTASQLCYFYSNNSLAVQVDQTLETSAGTHSVIGVGYVLKITLSDKSTLWVTSDDGQTFQYHHGGDEPSGWFNRNFDDKSWAKATIFDPTSMATTLINPQTNLTAKYFKTFTDGDNNLMHETSGERFYFRHKFGMNIGVPPSCMPPGSQPKPASQNPLPAIVIAIPSTSTPLPKPTSTFTPFPTSTPRPQPTSTFTSLPTSTPVPPRPTFTPQPVWIPKPPPPTATPVPVYKSYQAVVPPPSNSNLSLPPLPGASKPLAIATPTRTLEFWNRPYQAPTLRPTSTVASWFPALPKPTPRPVWIPRPRAMSTPMPVLGYNFQPSVVTSVPRVMPTQIVQPWLPTPRPRIYRPRNTPTEPPPPTETATPVPVRKKRATAVAVRKVMATPTLTAVPPQVTGVSGSVIAFSSLPVNIDASFADGPGRYQCEIVDVQGNHVNTVYNKQVAFEKETWISWDGTNDQGQLVHYGRYYAIFSKDGRLIQKMPLSYSAPN